VQTKANLFVKIFLGFWLVSAIILASWLVTARYFDALPDRRPGPGPEGAPRHFMLRLVYQLQNTPDEELPQVLRDTKQKHNIDIFLINTEGVDIYARKLIPGASNIARKLDRRHRRRFLETPQGFMQAHFIHRDTQGPLRAVMVFEPKRPGLVSLLNKNLGLRLALAIIVSGLLCYTLSRALTRRIKTLQSAARQLAQGHLTTRISVRDQGGDETDELARDLNSMAEQLDDKIHAQKRLLSDVSHELRSPLARLHVALALAQQDTRNNSQHLERIDIEAQRLEALIKQLLSTQRKNQVADTYVDLVQLLCELCADAEFEGKPQAKQVVFSTRLSQAVLPSYGDSLNSCFENILRNAVKYTADNTSIQASLTQHDTSYVIRVEDCGPGVKEQELEKLFDEFYRSDDARQRETGGYGLGLSISKRAVLQHAGIIQAFNTDKGLAIVVTLPITEE
jgi:signal transduction histidine kinase